MSKPVEVWITYRGLRFKVINSWYANHHQNLWGKDGDGPNVLANYTVHFTAPGADPKVVMLRVGELGGVIRGFNEGPLRVTSYCSLKAVGGCWEWGFWARKLTPTEADREEFRLLAGEEV